MNKISQLLYILVGMLLLTACDALGAVQPTLNPAEREAEEYAVYRAILDLNCVVSQTQAGDYIDPDEFPELDDKLIEDYNMHQRETVLLRPELDLGPQVTLISPSQWDEFFDSGDPDEGWRRFYEGTDCSGINEVSRVGFNEGMDMALVYFSGYVDSLAGQFGVMLLTKGEDGEWHFERFLSGGVS
jgi:hypothetical protein